MRWTDDFHTAIKAKVLELPRAVRIELGASLEPLKAFGPALGRPEIDTLKDSHYANRRELRFKADGGIWRAAFAFDPRHNGILLVAGDKSGVSERTFYKRLIDKADKRYKEHLETLESRE